MKISFIHKYTASIHPCQVTESDIHSEMRECRGQRPLPGARGHPSLPYYMFPSTHAKTGSMSTSDRINNNLVQGWQESDYLDYADFVNAIKNDEPVSFALCQWLIRQPHGNDDDGF